MGLKKFWVHKNFGSKQIFGPNKFLGQKNSEVQKFGSKKIGVKKKILGQKIFWVNKKFWIQKK